MTIAPRYEVLAKTWGDYNPSVLKLYNMLFRHSKEYTVQMRQLGKSGLGVSAIGFGAMGLNFAYGPGVDKHSALALYPHRL